jgi:D-serine dehydratase
MAHSLKLEPLLNEILDGTCKGFPGQAGRLRLGDIGRQNWQLLKGDLPFPVAVLSNEALGHNSHWMMQAVAHYGAAICPHGKTTMAPQLFDRQLRNGAWGITVATVQQAEVCCRFGVPRIFLANQLVAPGSIRALLEALARDGNTEIYVLVDSIEGVNRLRAGVETVPPGKPVNLLIEVGIPKGRAGCRDIRSAMAVAQAAAGAHPLLRLVGIEAFEGIVSGTTSAEREAQVAGFLQLLADLAVNCHRQGLFASGPVILSAGGSEYFDLVLRHLTALDLGYSIQTILRSGCYLTHDSGSFIEAFQAVLDRSPALAALGPGLQPALHIWTMVQSVPEPGLAIVTAGKRDVSYDVELPKPEFWYRSGMHEAPVRCIGSCRLERLNDQHGYVSFPETMDLRVGDLVALGISHPCTTFDKWQLLYIVDEKYRVIDAIRTYF